MSITLDAKLVAVVQEKVETGRYRDHDEVIREALEALEERERLQSLRAILDRAEEQAGRGEGRPFTPALFEELKRNAIRKAAAGHTPTPDV